jgi:hypothetical protein
MSPWMISLETTKKRQRENFEAVFGSLRLSDKQLTTAFRYYKNLSFKGIIEGLNSLNLNSEGLQKVLADTVFRGTPGKVFVRLHAPSLRP